MFSLYIWFEELLLLLFLLNPCCVIFRFFSSLTAKSIRGIPNISLSIVLMGIIVQVLWLFITLCAHICQVLPRYAIFTFPCFHHDQLCSLELFYLCCQALHIFAQKRPPGIYKQDYIQALYTFYHESPENLVCPPTPEWKRSSDLDLNGEAVQDDDGDDNGDPSALSHVSVTWIFPSRLSSILFSSNIYILVPVFLAFLLV